jgi:hypothetical protein
MNAADHSSRGPKNSLHLRGHPHMHAETQTVFAFPTFKFNLISGIPAKMNTGTMRSGDIVRWIVNARTVEQFVTSRDEQVAQVGCIEPASRAQTDARRRL